MEKELKKKRMRKIALLVVAAVLIAGAVIGMKVERADYGKALASEITQAQKLLDSAEIGTKKGQYLETVYEEYKVQIEEAQALLDDTYSNYEQEKAACENLKAAEDSFRKASNKEDLTKKEVKKKEKKKKKVKKKKKDEKADASDEEDDPDDADKAKDKKEDKKASKDKKKKKSSTEKKKKKNKDKKKKKDDNSTATETKYTVSIQIRCDTIAKNPSKITNDSIRGYIPSNGVILSTEYQCEPGATVYDVLYNCCRNNSIHMEAVYQKANGSYYIEGINHIYEFDAGDESGWMYKVNGSFPNYGCSGYTVKNGDRIVWCYTTNLGKDVGDEF